MPSSDTMTREEKLRLLISKVLWERKLWSLPKEMEDEMERIAIELKVPPREDCVRNFIAAYCVIKGLMNRATADRVIASSTRGRIYWEKKIRERYSLQPWYEMQPWRELLFKPED